MQRNCVRSQGWKVANLTLFFHSNYLNAHRHSLIVCNIATGKPLSNMSHDGNRVTGVGFCANDQSIVSVCGDGALRVWNKQAATVLQRIQLLEGELLGCDIYPTSMLIPLLSVIFFHVVIHLLIRSSPLTLFTLLLIPSRHKLCCLLW